MFYWYQNFLGDSVLPSGMTKSKLKKYQNNQTFLDILNPVINLILSIFKWDGLPETWNPRALEISLLWRAWACVIPYGNGTTNAMAGPGSGYNIHGEYTSFWAYGWNGFNRLFQNYIKGADISPELYKNATGLLTNIPETGVLIRDNYMDYPMILTVIDYVERLAATMNRNDEALFFLVWPGIIEGTTSQKATVEALFQKHKEGVPLFVDRETLDSVGIKLMNFGVSPDASKTLWENYDRLFSQLMEFFGIESNPAANKAERINTMETSANNMRTALYRDNRLHCRQEAAERINKLFGLNISVDYDENIVQRVEEAKQQSFMAAAMTPDNPGGGANDGGRTENT